MTTDFRKAPLREVPGRHRSTRPTPAQLRARKQREAIVAGCLVLVLVLALLPFTGWVLMLVMGALHGAFAAVPAIGYGTAVLFMVGINMLLGVVRRPKQ